MIFQGKVLHDDEASLSSCGLHDNCVVLYSIHQPCPTANAQQSPDPVNQDTAEQPLPNTIRHGYHQPWGPDQLEWNFETFLTALDSLCMSLYVAAFLQSQTSFSTGTQAILTAIFFFAKFLTDLIYNEE